MEASVAPTLAAEPRARTAAGAIPWYLSAVLFASTSVVVGVIWDISWHKTIGRDTLWSPPHLAIYLGGIVAGLSCGLLVLRTTFGGQSWERERSVSFWRLFRAPLGAWVCIWGAFAMLTSAPFDDWWHAAYGLDVEILSPPHSVLALGILSVNIGALLMALAWQNRATGASERVTRLAFAYAGGALITLVAIMITEYTFRTMMHSSIFYKVTAGVFPLFLIALARGSRLRWPATTIAAVYTAIMCLMAWILPLFPAEPRLGPIYHEITHMVPMDFPLLLIVPALALDLAIRRWPPGGWRDWLRAPLYGALFFAAFLVAQWLFAYFLMSPYSANRIFVTDNYPHMLPMDTYAYRREFAPIDASTAARNIGLLWALGFAMLSARVGLWWGAWMERVRR